MMSHEIKIIKKNYRRDDNMTLYRLVEGCNCCSMLYNLSQGLLRDVCDCDCHAVAEKKIFCSNNMECRKV